MTGTFIRDGVALNVSRDGGAGRAILFQHGLCGAATQTMEAFPKDPRFARVTVECRGHGVSESGDPAQFSIATFTDDVATYMRAAGLRSTIVGGISMGAAIALRLAVTAPDLVSGLVLVRPAWVTEAAPATNEANRAVGRLLQTLPPDEAKAAFLASPLAQRIARESPDNMASLTGFFAREPIAITAALLSAIAADGPGVTPAQLAALALPTLVIGCGEDVIHPLEYARDLSTLIPGAGFAEIFPKGRDRARHLAELHQHMLSFFEDTP
ncbi:MAG: alpha/beta hydrolase [Hyphomicrobiales bacterium]